MQCKGNGQDRPEASGSTEAAETTATSSGEVQALIERGQECHKAGDLKTAAELYWQALGLAPDHPVALHLLGAIALQCGATDAAVALLDRAALVESGNAWIWNSLGAALREMGDIRQAIAAFRRSIGAKRDLMPAHLNLAAALQADGRPDEAIAVLEHAILIDPDFLEGRERLGEIQLAAGKTDGAIATFKQLAALTPRAGEPFHGLGRASLAQGNAGEALRYLRRAAELRSHHAPTLLDLAKAALALNHLEEAAGGFRRAAELEPDDKEAHAGLGLVLARLDDRAGAEAAYRRLEAIDPTDANAHFGHGILLLAAGAWAEGWEHYRLGQGLAARDPVPPDAAPPRDRPVTVHGPVSLSEQVLFAGIVGELAADAGPCTFFCSPWMKTLFAQSLPGVEVRGPAGPGEAPADAATQAVTVRSGDLGCWYRAADEAFPTSGGYLRADPALVEDWRGRFAARGQGPIIGLCWAGHASGDGPFNTTLLLDWRPILEAVDAVFVDLQHTDPFGEIEAIRRMTGRTIVAERSAGLPPEPGILAAKTAACDLVISVDTLIVHLAAALGRPAWVLLPRREGLHWCWLKDGDRTPWYPTARLFRQTRPGDWASTIAAVAAALPDALPEEPLKETE